MIQTHKDLPTIDQSWCNNTITTVELMLRNLKKVMQAEQRGRDAKIVQARRLLSLAKANGEITVDEYKQAMADLKGLSYRRVCKKMIVEELTVQDPQLMLKYAMAKDYMSYMSRTNKGDRMSRYYAKRILYMLDKYPQILGVK